MLTSIDHELFPDDCEVVEIPSHNLWVYLIQKNASTGLRRKSKNKNWKIYQNDQIKTLEYIDIFLRDPIERYVSGVNTFLQFTIRDNPQLDSNTVLWLAKRYSFLNRHFLPQWHWLVNLSRFINDNCKIRFHRIDDLSDILETKNRAGIVPPSDDLVDQIVSHTQSLELWFFLDQILLDLSGKSMTWKEVIEHYRTQHNQCFKLATEKFYQLADVLPKT